MEPTAQLIDELYRERVRRARAASPEEKLLDGPRLFDFACRITRDGIRMQFPGADDHEVRRILLQRLALAEQLERNP